MKITIHNNPPAGYAPEPVIKIFSPLDDPSICVMAQLYRESELLLNRGSAWVAIPTERVEKIRFVSNPEPKTNEQIPDFNSSRPRHD